jgi:hypothetical protein|tara:strand:- start:275 stop:394 length:120 start_codon:yes stop_codon:yes gene_type:complete
MIKVGDLFKQGICIVCKIPLFGYKKITRKYCGKCNEEKS